MAESDLDKRLRELRAQRLGEEPADKPASAECPPAYGYLTLLLARKDGTRWGFPYAGIASQSLNADRETLLLRFSFDEVTIRGRGLNRLFDLIATRACGQIDESAGAATAVSDETETAVTSITVRSLSTS
ncbi:MAG TPA: hypothetical protein VFF65_12085 [Phycisphaerales bacterium]|nr:hypothetical protein [Phycisphaerales bacterium]